jgi:ribonuclease-3
MNHVFAKPELYEEALTHTSFAYENGGEHNERLEFLGDAVLQLCSTDILYARFPADREGVLHGYRTQLVSTGHLAQQAKKWGLGERLRLGKGEEATGGREKERVLAGVFEAVLGAIYLDAGYAAVSAVVGECLSPDLEQLPSVAEPRKTLHEWCQRTYGRPPEYRVSDETGPAHSRIFTIVVICDDDQKGTGTGPSKKAATIEAARSAVEKMGLE